MFRDTGSMSTNREVSTISSLNSSERFNSIAEGYRTSEVHRGSPTLERLHELLPEVKSVCDVACGAGHTALSFAEASHIVCVDPASNMLQQVRKLAEESGMIVKTVESFAESITLPSSTFDLVVSRLAAHHFKDVQGALREMFRLAKPGGHVAVIDLEGDEYPAVDSFNHEVETLHDPTHVRSYTATQWREMFRATGLIEVACEARWREFPGGLTVCRWCELGNSGEENLNAIRERMVSAPATVLSALDITRDPDGEFRIPIRTLLLIGRRPVC